MTPVSLLASMMETRQVLGLTAARRSSASIRPVTVETATQVTSGTKNARMNPYSFLFLFILLKVWHKRLYKTLTSSPAIRSSRTLWFLTSLSGLLQVLRHQLDRVVLHVGDDDVRPTRASVQVLPRWSSWALIFSSGASPEVLQDAVEHQVIGLEGKRHTTVIRPS